MSEEVITRGTVTLAKVVDGKDGQVSEADKQKIIEEATAGAVDYIDEQGYATEEYASGVAASAQSAAESTAAADATAKANDAAKTATNYITENADGSINVQNTSSTSNIHANVGETAFSVMDGEYALTEMNENGLDVYSIYRSEKGDIHAKRAFIGAENSTPLLELGTYNTAGKARIYGEIHVLGDSLPDELDNRKAFTAKSDGTVDAYAGFTVCEQPLLVTTVESSATFNTAGGTTISAQHKAISKFGYKPIGIVGIYETYTSNGMYVNLNFARVQSDGSGGYEINYRFRNSGSAALNNFQLHFTVLWQAVTAGRFRPAE